MNEIVHIQPILPQLLHQGDTSEMMPRQQREGGKGSNAEDLSMFLVNPSLAYAQSLLYIAYG